MDRLGNVLPVIEEVIRPKKKKIYINVHTSKKHDDKFRRVRQIDTLPARELWRHLRHDLVVVV